MRTRPAESAEAMLKEPVNVVEKLLEVMRQHMTRSVTSTETKKEKSIATIRQQCGIDTGQLFGPTALAAQAMQQQCYHYLSACRVRPGHPKKESDVHKETINALGRPSPEQQTALYWKRRDGTSQEEGKARARGCVLRVRSDGSAPSDKLKQVEV